MGTTPKAPNFPHIPGVADITPASPVVHIALVDLGADKLGAKTNPTADHTKEHIAVAPAA